MTRYTKILHILDIIPTLRDNDMQLVVTATGKPDHLDARMNVDETTKFDIDFSPWLEGKGTITSTTWTVRNGNASVVDTDQSALISVSNAGISLISCLVETSTGEAKKVWLLIKAEGK